MVSCGVAPHWHTTPGMQIECSVACRVSPWPGWIAVAKGSAQCVCGLESAGWRWPLAPTPQSQPWPVGSTREKWSVDNITWKTILDLKKRRPNKWIKMNQIVGAEPEPLASLPLLQFLLIASCPKQENPLVTSPEVPNFLPIGPLMLMSSYTLHCWDFFVTLWNT